MTNRYRDADNTTPHHGDSSSSSKSGSSSKPTRWLEMAIEVNVLLTDKPVIYTQVLYVIPN